MTAAETKSADFVIARLFDAPRQLVWQCFTDPQRMKAWWGPKGSTLVASNMDLRVGGIYHGAMRGPDGRVMWAKFVYREIVAPEREKPRNGKQRPWTAPIQQARRASISPPRLFRSLRIPE